MIEFVLVFPIQLLLTLCILQYAYLAHAQLVVGHAAFMGARAAAVADGNLMEGMSQQDAARREAARICAQLTSGEPGGTGQVPPNGELKWQAEGGGYMVKAPYQSEAYELLEPVLVNAEDQDGYVSVDLTFNYVMTIPVANHLFARFARPASVGGGGGGGDEFFFGTQGSYNTASTRFGRTVFPIRRAGFISTPWTKPVGGGQ